jgi:hypothetical protein
MDQMIKDQSLDPAWDAIEAHLLHIKRAAVLELRNYPQPIAGCDAQIPALWEKRDGIAAELDRLDQARREPAVDILRAIDTFIETSPFMDDHQKEKFRALATPKAQSAAE